MCNPNSIADIDNLVRYKNSAGGGHAPAQTRMRSGSSASRLARPDPVAAAAPVFDELYRDTRPGVTLQESKVATLIDPLHRHGAQMMELRAVERKRE